jgi:EAL domain-containing protein (putative c-di-GMP-specific phosphodiesterase class I)
LRDALGSLRGWIDAGVVPPSTTMSVNVSPRQVADPTFATIVRSAVAESGVPPHLLWVEITESMMLDEPELAADTLEEIRSMGVRIAMDDFGTGFSSLSVLQQFPIQRIKIDRAFVNGLGVRGNDRSLVRTIIAMARSMALDLVAEGVETVEQLHALRDLGCDKAQGFLISRPVPADAMRSTMVALDEMATLSIFEPTVAEPAPAMAGPAPEAARAPRPEAQFAVTGPMGTMSSRPLGSPRL